MKNQLVGKKMLEMYILVRRYVVEVKVNRTVLDAITLH